jgi:hypothetical protein
MNTYIFRLDCKSGDFGWGQTGQKGWATASGEDEVEAYKKVASQVPGGWVIGPGRETELEAGQISTASRALADTLLPGPRPC